MPIGILSACYIVVIMIRRTAALSLPSPSSADRIRVAILGSGVSGCAAASTLLASEASSAVGFDVTVYERGRGVGGRTSTRIVKSDRDDGGGGADELPFDHGCVCVGPPRSEAFRTALGEWEANGWLRPWNARVGTLRCLAEPKGTLNKNTFAFELDDAAADRYVGYPRMSSICENLLRTECERSSLKVVTSVDARAVHVPSFTEEAVSDDPAAEGMWRIVRVGADPTVFETLGHHDWLVATDRASAHPNRPDLRHANVDKYASAVTDKVQSMKSITTMVALDQPLDVPFDILDFEGNSNENLLRKNFGTLGRIVRESSKPGRGNPEGGECWVLHGSRRESETLLNRADLRDASLPRIRDQIREVMIEDFEAAMPLLLSINNVDKDNHNADEVNKYGDQRQKGFPKVIHSVGHRWGGAFPLHADRDDMFEARECYLDASKRFVACGDYFGKDIGSVEAAFLSGRAAAESLLRHVGDVDR